jgi:hypothetical protein
MKYQPIGSFRWPNHHDAVLINWSRAAGIRIGRPAYAGWAFFVSSVGSDTAFFVEHRGPGHKTLRRIWTFDRNDVATRRIAFKDACKFFLKVTQQRLPV